MLSKWPAALRKGGGYSPFSLLHGLAANNVLVWDAVCVDGRLVRGTPRHNADLYWVLSGGGSGTYAVVASMTMRMHRNVGPTGSA